MFSHRTNWQLIPNALTRAIEEARASGQKILDLTISNPTEAGIRPEPETVLAALANPKAMRYDPQPRGLLEARQAVCSYYRESHQVDLDPERVLLTTSTSEAYSYVFRLLCNPGDEVLVPKPSYPLFEFLVDLSDVKLIPYPLLYDHGWEFDFHSLQRAATPQTRAVILVHPNNPTGSYVSASETAALNDFCRNHGLALIADEVFLDYPHDLTPRRSFATNQRALTFTLSGISKISALPQMKLAWVVLSGPEGVVEDAGARLEIIADTYLSMNAPIQLAAPVLLDQRKKIQPILLDRLRSNLAELDTQLASHPSCTRLQVDGGWYAILRVPVIETDEDLAIRLLKKGSVSVHPGHFFDFPNDGYLVLSLITEPAEFRDGVSRLLPVVAA
ncbi:MAG TPA: pyridoxal phosphate-dependent aminotransferase [Terriglobales bacterium]|jgi:alanine-synthesizing transaminase|nr:pyridoxal phosphate-dependent aminotransferase [Terriglobales bacterium]